MSMSGNSDRKIAFEVRSHVPVIAFKSHDCGSPGMCAMAEICSELHKEKDPADQPNPLAFLLFNRRGTARSWLC
jgi:hypothetical protein